MSNYESFSDGSKTSDQKTLFDVKFHDIVSTGTLLIKEINDTNFISGTSNVAAIVLPGPLVINTTATSGRWIVQNLALPAGAVLDIQVNDTSVLNNVLLTTFLLTGLAGGPIVFGNFAYTPSIGFSFSIYNDGLIAWGGDFTFNWLCV